MALLKWIIGGLVGASVGIALWAAVVYLTGYEVGIIAAFLGIFVGVGIAAGAGPNRGVGAAVFAGAFALLAVLGGKVAVAWLYSQKYMEEMTLAPEEITDEFLVSCIADEVLYQYEDAGYELDYPAGADLDFPDSESDYPEDVWAEAESQWDAMAAEEQQAFRAQYELGAEAAPIAAFVLALVFSFGLFDLVWIGLAVSSAYKIVRDVPKPKQTAQTFEVEPVQFFPGLPPPNVAPTPQRAAPQPGAAPTAADPGPFIPGMPAPGGAESGDLRRAG